MGCRCGKTARSGESREVRTYGKQTRIVETREVRKDGKTTKIVVIKREQPAQKVTVAKKIEQGGKEPKATKLAKPSKGTKGKNAKANKAKSKISNKEDAKEGLKSHNSYRAKHKAPGIKLNSALSKSAQKWAETLLKTNRFEHSEKKARQHRGKYVGENIAYYQGGGEYSAADATKSWYDEVQKYSFNIPRSQPGTGHFTQVVWKGTRELGIGRAEDPNTGKVLIVGRYLPGGNVVGNYQENVLRPR